MSTDRRIELQAPDISRWRAGNTGTEFVWSFDSGRRGPHVMVQALTHGNEICGAIALDWQLPQPVELHPARGRLTLAFANVDAYSRWNPQEPDRSRFVDEDLNRVWADEVLLSARDSAELRRARELRPFVDSADAAPLNCRKRSIVSIATSAAACSQCWPHSISTAVRASRGLPKWPRSISRRPEGWPVSTSSTSGTLSFLA